MGREDPQLKLRLTDELKSKVAEAAKSSNRSVNAEIVDRLEQSFDGSKDKLIQDLLVRVAVAETRAETAFDVFKFTSGIIAEASGHDDEARSLLAKAIRSLGSVSAIQKDEDRANVVKRMAEALKSEPKSKQE